MSKELEIKENAVELKQFAKGLNGEYVTLVSIENTKDILNELAEKHKELEITEDNYKKEGALAEKELRTLRYSLQNIHKSNNSIILQAKKEEKELFDTLIGITVDIEKRIKTDIESVKEKVKQKKLAKEREEKERVERIVKKISDIEIDILKRENKIKGVAELDALIGYVKNISEEEKEYEEYHYKILDIKSSSLKRLDFKLDEIYRLEKEKKEKDKIEKEKKELDLQEKERKQKEEEKQKEVKKKVTELRAKILKGKKITLHASQYENLNELEWFDLVNGIEEERELKIISDKKKEEELKKSILVGYGNILIVLEGLGVEVGKFRENKEPSSEDLGELKRLVEKVHAKEQTKIKKRIKKELKPYVDEVTKDISKVEKKYSNDAKIGKEAKQIMKIYTKRVEEVINEVFGEVISL